jgi:acetyl-CoA synthetase
VSALAVVPDCNVIACAFEGLADPLKFKRAADKARQLNKPLIVYKLATGEEGAAAAMSHTASLAGSAQLWQAVFDDAGAVTVLDFDALIETAVFFAKSPLAKADGLAVLSGSGGAAIMAADFAEELGVPIPQPSEPVVNCLRELIPPYVPARNPCDVTAGVINDRDTLIACADALMGDDRYGALIYGYTYAYDTATERLPYLSAVAAKHGKPLIYVWLTQLGEGPGTIEAEQDPNVIVVRSMRRAMEILKKWQDWSAWTADRDACTHSEQSAKDPAAEAKCRAQIADLRRDHNGVLGEAASKSLLSHYEIKVTQDRLCTSGDEAAQAAQRIAAPVVMKIDSPDIPHKSDAGGVVLNVQGAGAAQQTYDQIIASVTAAHPSARINGVLVQEMVPQGLEIIAGFRNAPGFGPVITLGLGGVLTEVLDDTATALAPVSAAKARAMLRSLRGARLLSGYRGAPPVDLAALSQTIARLSDMAADLTDEIAECDVNPIIALPDRAVAVDGLVILHKSEAQTP